VHRVAAEHGASITPVDAQPHLAPGVLGAGFKSRQATTDRAPALFFKYRPRRPGRLGLSRLTELKSCHTEHAFEVNLW